MENILDNKCKAEDSDEFDCFNMDSYSVVDAVCDIQSSQAGLTGIVFAAGESFAFVLPIDQLEERG